MTTNNPSNPLGLNNPANRTSVYRPRYRSRMANPTYALEGTTAIRGGEISGFLEPLEELDAWRAEEEHRAAEKGVRWRPEKLASLKIYLAPVADPQVQPAFWQACREWEAVSAGLIQFYPATGPEDADIVVQWQQETVVGRDFEVGHTHRTVQAPHWIQRVEMTLIEQPEIDKRLSTSQIRQRLFTTFLHELGHALGLEHSNSRRDVMHHQGWQNARLTNNDTERLTRLYQKRPPLSSWL